MSVLRLGRRAMGSLFEVIVLGEDEALARAAAEAALDEVERLDEQLSLYLPGSALCRLNARAAGEAVRVDPELYALLARARDLHADTGGAFDVAVAPLMKRWGFRGAGSVSGMRHVALADGTVRFCRDGVALDLGGIAKGHAVDRAVAVLRAHGLGRALVHGGRSSVYGLGAPPGDAGWRVGLVDPRDEERRLGTVALKDRALSVSSGLGRTGDGGAGHVMDPRAGRPVAGDRAAWVVGASATGTDALATAVLVAGELRDGAVLLDRRGLRWRGVDVAAAAPRVSRRRFIRAAAVAVGAGLAAAPAAAQEDARPLEVAVIGVGDQGALLLRQLVAMKGVTVPAVCDVRPEARALGVTIAGRDVETYADAAHLLEEEGSVDAVVVATPTHLHAGPALAALKARKHVFCEAPLARTVDDCKAIVRAAREAGTVFQTGHQRRCSTLYPHALSHIKSGAIGRIVQVRAQRNRKQAWRRAGGRDRNWRLYRETSGGLLLEHASHVIDLANWYLGAVPEVATGLGGVLKWQDGRETFDAVQLLVRYPQGPQLNFGASLVNTYGDEHEIVVGDAAAILLTRQRRGLLFKESDTVSAGWEAYAKKEMLGGWRGIILDAMATKYDLHDKGEQLGPDADTADYYAELETFLACVRAGKPAPCGALDGLKAAVPAILAGEAIRSGTVTTFTKEHYEA